MDGEHPNTQADGARVVGTVAAASLDRAEQRHRSQIAALTHALAVARAETEAETAARRAADAALQATRTALSDADIGLRRAQAEISELRGQLERAWSDAYEQGKRRVEAEAALLSLRASTVWRLTAPLRLIAGWLPRRVRRGVRGALHVVWWSASWQLGQRLRERRAVLQELAGQPAPSPIEPELLPTLPPPEPAPAPEPEPPRPAQPPIELTRTEPVDIVVCVHDALDSVRDCLRSVRTHTAQPYRLILVDDGSLPETAAFLDAAALEPGTLLLRNPAALGYTKAANIGLSAVTSPWVVLLNSDTVVSSGWLDRMWAHGASDERVGVIGPLSNTASWQSVPRVFDGTDWAENALPPGWDIDAMAALATAQAIGAVPLPFINGFCYMIRTAALRALGPFDEAVFGGGYGEENDFSIRARQAGWTLVVATDAYVYHAQSRSYAPERRLALAKAADDLLQLKYDAKRDIWPQASACRDSVAMASVRGRVAGALQRQELVAEGRQRFGGRRVAFILPIESIGGGANVVLQEGAALASMGVEVTLLNEAAMQERLGPHPDLRGLTVRTFGTWEAMTAHLRRDGAYDAVIATLYKTVYMLPLGADVRLGYYVQDFEPYFFTEGSPERESALLSYGLSDQVRLLTKTRWNQAELSRQTGRHAALLGPSVDVTAFAPDPAREAGGPFRVVAMVRPATPRRAPEWTRAVLDRVRTALGERVAIDIFGAEDAELEAAGLRTEWAVNAGRLDRAGLARLLGRADVFLDCSTYQAMGLTALEAMLSGCAVIAPERGGANEFIRTGVNGFLLDTIDQIACTDALVRLANDAALLTEIRLHAVADANRFLPEAAALRLLAALFDA